MMYDVYISSSWKNRNEVRSLAWHMRAAGLKVYDFTDPDCRETEEIPPEKFPEQFDPEQHVYREYLDRPEWRGAVEANQRALDNSRAVLMLLPCGIDSTADWAYAVGQGKPTIIVGHPRAGERTPTHLWADALVEDYAEATRWLEERLRGGYA